MRDLTYCNYSKASGTLRDLNTEEVRRILVQSRCGLALSAQEGAMYASGEYLLAGLPVVTTRSRGGRDAFTIPIMSPPSKIDPRRWRQRSSISKNVNSTRPPSAIGRSHCFASIAAGLIARLCEIVQCDLFALADGSMWLPQFTHQMRKRLKVNLGAEADQGVA